MSCTAEGKHGIIVRVRDAATGAGICDAVVVVRDGAYNARLTPVACSYVGAGERPGVYSVEVLHPLYVRRDLAGVAVADGGTCDHVITREIAIDLEKSIP